MSFLIPDDIKIFLNEFRSLLTISQEALLNKRNAFYSDVLVPVKICNKFKGMKGEFKVKSNENLSCFFVLEEISFSANKDEGLFEVFSYATDMINKLPASLKECTSLYKGQWFDKKFNRKERVSIDVTIKGNVVFYIFIVEINPLTGEPLEGDGVFEKGILNTGLIIKK